MRNSISSATGPNQPIRKLSDVALVARHLSRISHRSAARQSSSPRHVTHEDSGSCGGRRIRYCEPQRKFCGTGVLTSMPDPISTSDHSPSTDTVAALLPLDADGPALVSDDGEVISHATLRKEVDRLAEQLRSAGLGPKDRLAIVLPNGPAMALVMLAAMTVGCAAPLNPKYREDEFRFYLDDLHASALLTLDGASSDAHAAAPEGTIPIVVRGQGMSIDLVTPQTMEGSTRRPTADDLALVLHTSGTTSRPKIVPLRQRNLARSARNIAVTLRLTSADRSLNV